MMPSCSINSSTTNGIRMHYVEQGAGPLVVLCHGWPESWYSWRHQIPALAAAGFRVVAPDQRGYGQTDAPAPIESYNILNLVGDIVGLVNSLGVESARDRWSRSGARRWRGTRRCCGLTSFARSAAERSVFSARSDASDRRDEGARRRPAFLPALFPGAGQGREGTRRRSAPLDGDDALLGVGRSRRAEGEFSFLFPKTKKFIETGTVPGQAAAVADRGRPRFLRRRIQARGLSRRNQLVSQYRSQLGADAAFSTAPSLRQPAVFAAGEHDVVLAMYPVRLRWSIFRCRIAEKKVIIPGAGHWLQQERPKEINDLLSSS